MKADAELRLHSNLRGLSGVPAGAGLALASRPDAGPRSRLIVRVCAAAVALIGLLILLEQLLGWDLGIDQLLFRDFETTATSFPGRVRTNAAFNFSLLGPALLLLTLRGRRSLLAAQLLSLAALLVCFVALLGYVYLNNDENGIGAYTQLALPAAVAGALLSLGLLFARPEEGMMAIASADSAGGLMVRRLTPAVVVVLPLLGWLAQLGG